MMQHDLLAIENGSNVPDGQLGITWRADDGPVAHQPYERVTVLAQGEKNGCTIFRCQTLDPEDQEDLIVEVFGVHGHNRIGIVTWR